MSNLQYYAYPGVGVWGREKLSYSQAVRVGDRIECSGQGGWDRTATTPGEGFIPQDLEDEIDQAFENVEANLKHAGGKGWSQVFRVNSYHKDFSTQAHERMVYNYRKWMPNHQPIWTEIGVAKLGLDEMRVEIEVSAYDEEGAREARKA